MWGSRRKKDVEDNAESAPEETNFKPPTSRHAATTAKRHAGAAAGSFGGMSASGMEEMLTTYLNMFEELLNSNDFDSIKTMLNPETIKTMLEQFPGAADSPEVATLMNSPEFNDPEMLRQTMKEGLQFIRSSASDIISMFSDPEKLDELLAQLPPEMRTLMESLQAGDLSGIKDLVRSFPGLEESQKNMLLGLMEGNTDALNNELQKVLGDSEQIEAARQQFLANPELAESMGLPMDLVRDPQKWAQMMAQGAETLMGGGGAAAAAGKAAENGGKFGRFNGRAA
eukprot:CAMPEP_0174954624 /NCGR_PEP_ID=MMETSP0004_2-20121128/530_1 /TAXON_ID=420556 /ORGANISM="Ochromonas sp., Strain CCMP1393" /LENGTH=283 /DNA_ID=CAMNT_0016202463 /DNA_START=40 /DNA_END=891 /DNA_ORIENTATION=-